MGAAVAQPGWSAALVRRIDGTNDGTAHGTVFHASSTPGVALNNPFSFIDIESEIREFLNWAKSRLAPKTYDNVKRYSRFVYYLAIPTSLLTALNNSGLGDWGKHHVMKVLSNFAKFLDAKYATDQFTTAWQRIRRALGLKWTKPASIPSIFERLEDPEQTYINIINNIRSPKHRAFAALLLVTGLRPEEAHFLWENYKQRVREIDGAVIAELMLLRRTKNAFFAFIHPRIHEIVKSRPRHWERISLKKFRMSWREACQRLGLDHRKWRPYELRDLHATTLLRVMPPPDVDMLQGRVGKTVLAQHYNIESLKRLWKMYIRAMDPLVSRLKLEAKPRIDSLNVEE